MDEERRLPGALEVRLQEVADDDLPMFFEHHQDLVANQLAAFTAKDPADRDRFDRHWISILGEDTIVIRTILNEGEVAGDVLSFMQDGKREVSYWLGREYWGQGSATRAHSMFLAEVTARPLHARAAKDNAGSIRVLQNCGFTSCGEQTGFANARNSDRRIHLRADRVSVRDRHGGREQSVALS